MSFWRRLIIGALSILISVPSFAQKKSEQVDSLVNLLSAQSMELIEKDGVNYRKVTGPARFLHNNTYLICDTALWNVNNSVIDAIGNVKILQNSTVLTSDKLTYFIDDDLAEFRGHVVQLEDKDKDILRTRYLDYNTKDSVAVFRNGGAMKDKDGQIIESFSGTYDSKIKTFTFKDNVNMFTDSIFVKTTSLEYRSKQNLAIFGKNTDAWKDDDMLSSNSGWYDRDKELFLFTKDVHGMTDTQEGWADSLYFYRNTRNVEMLGNVQVTDSTRKSTAVAGRMVYTDSLSRIMMTRNPALIAVTDSTGTVRDTVYVGADTLRMRTIPKCAIEDIELADAKTRLEYMANDAIGTYRKTAAEEAKKAAEDAKNQDEEYLAEQAAKAKRDAKAASSGKTSPASAPPAATDSLSVAGDSLKVTNDSLSVAKDSIAVVPPPDSTKVGFIEGLKNVRLYRDDFQMRCDSLKFNELDSLVRMYKSPVVWNEGNRQYAADSIYVSFGKNSLDKAYLMSNAFVAIEEAPECYDQIRSVEMLAYFDDKGNLRRFDATGGTDAVFYIKEDSTYATVNKSQAKLMCALLKDGDIDSVSYFEDATNNAYPLAQMTRDDRILKGFNWTPENKPAGPEDITVYEERPSERNSYASRSRAKFHQTEIYFPGYMAGVYKKIADNERKSQEKVAKKDSLAALPKVDSVSMATPVEIDSSASASSVPIVTAPADSTIMAPVPELSDNSPASDTTAVQEVMKDTTATVPTPDPKALAKARKDAERAAALAERDAKWARLDSLDKVKETAKQEAKAEKARQKKLKAIMADRKQAVKDAAKLEKYRLRYERKYGVKPEETPTPEPSGTTIVYAVDPEEENMETEKEAD